MPYLVATKRKIKRNLAIDGDTIATHIPTI